MSAVTVFLRGVGMCVEGGEGARVCAVVLGHTLTGGGGTGDGHDQDFLGLVL